MREAGGKALPKGDLQEMMWEWDSGVCLQC